MGPNTRIPLERRDANRRLSDDQYNALVKAAAREAADIIYDQLALVVRIERNVIRTILWIIGATSIALGSWHHQALWKMILEIMGA